MSARTYVSFRHPAPFLPVSEAEDVLSMHGTAWFTALLKRVGGLSIHTDLCQEDWGVVVFAERGGKRFWIGLSNGLEEGSWLVHLHHGVWTWRQRLSASGRHELDRLAESFHAILSQEPAVTEIAWHREIDTTKAQPPTASTPDTP